MFGDLIRMVLNLKEGGGGWLQENGGKIEENHILLDIDEITPQSN